MKYLQGSSTNSLPVPPAGVVHGGVSGMDGQTDPQMLQAQNYPSPFPPNAFHRQLSQQAPGVRNSAKLPNVCCFSKLKFVLQYLLFQKT